ncbi:MAG: helicase HerA-like domain-containing protein [Filifactoraceae bacterium]
MILDNKLFVAFDKAPINILPNMACRHGLIAGATGTGKTITLKVLAEGFSSIGVPVFLADVKGDVSGMCLAGSENEKIKERLSIMNISDFEYKSFPTRFWDVYGEKGHPIRATISQIGPLLLSRILNLNEIQTGVLTVVFKVADDNKLLLLDIKDLKAMLQYCSGKSKELSVQYGNISTASISAIQRSLLLLEEAGGNIFFGEPDLDIMDWFKTDGPMGYINILHCAKLFLEPRLYSTFLIWLLSELYEALPEVGEVEKPKMVFFFDEAHLLFKDAPKTLMDKIEQVVRLVRSKGVSIFFISQSPSDIPNAIQGQLANRIQHALRAYSPSEQKAVKAAAQTFRENPEFDSYEAILSLSTGEALVSFLDEKGSPSIAQKALILPPQSMMAPCDDNIRIQHIASSEFFAKYTNVVDNQSAFEDLQNIKTQETNMAEAEKQEAQKEKEREETLQQMTKIATKIGTSILTSVGKKTSRSLIRGLFNTLKK